MAVVSLLVVAATLTATFVGTPFSSPAPTVQAASATTRCDVAPAGGRIDSPPLASYTPVTPQRLLDTRSGIGGVLGAIPAGCTVELTLGAEVPGGVSAVALSLTGISDASDYMTVFPCALGRPGTSNLNYRTGATANLVVATPDVNRRVCIYTHAAAHVLVDLSGWWSQGADRYHSTAPTRIHDSRQAGGTTLEPFQPRTITVPAAVAPADATSVAINLTTTLPEAPGYFTAYPCGGEPPNASNLNFLAYEDRAVAAIVGLTPGQQFCVMSSVRSHLVIDVNGYYSPAPSFDPAPFLQTTSGERVVDTRNGIGGPRQPFAPFEVRSYDPLTAIGGSTYASAVLVNVITDGARAPGYVTLYPCGGAVPTASSLNYGTQWVTSNLAAVQLSPGRQLCVQTSSATDVIIDVFGLVTVDVNSPVESLSFNHEVFPRFDAAATDYAIKCRAATQNVVFDIDLRAGISGVIQPGGAPVIDGRNTRSIATDDLMTLTLTGNGQTRRYHFRCLPPDFPDYSVRRPGSPAAPGWYLTTAGALGSPGGPYAVIFDEYGAPVWYKRTAAPMIDLKRMSDGALIAAPAGPPFGVDPANGYWKFTTAGASITRFRTSDPTNLPVDNHEMLEIPGVGRVMLSYPTDDDQTADLRAHNPPVDVYTVPNTPFPGNYTANQPFADGLIEEVADNGTSIWQWRMSAHIPPEETVVPIRFTPLSPAVDVYHINSMDRTPEGDYVLSARMIDAAMRVDRASGEIEWILGGDPASTNRLCGSASALRSAGKCLRILGDPLGGIKRPHDARLRGDVLTVFDNRADTPGPSRAIAYRIDPVAMTATMLWEIRQPTGQIGGTLGSVRTGSDGSVLVGWGAPIQPMYEEYSSTGQLLLSIDQPGGYSYRIVKEPKSAFDATTLRGQAGHGTIAAPPP